MIFFFIYLLVIWGNSVSFLAFLRHQFISNFFKRNSLCFVIWSMHTTFFFSPRRNPGIFLVTKQSVLSSLKQSKISQQAVHFGEWPHHDRKVQRSFPHQIRMTQLKSLTQQTSAHLKSAHGMLQPKTFPSCCNSKAPMVVQWNSGVF